MRLTRRQSLALTAGAAATGLGAGALAFLRRPNDTPLADLGPRHPAAPAYTYDADGFLIILE